MASYTRQSSFSDGDTISASLFNNEYNQLVTAFSYASSGTTGHRHDGTAGEGGNIHTIGDQDFLNKIVVDSSNNRWGFYVEVSAAAVEQVRIQDGAIVPVTDNDIDLGTSSLEFKDLYIDGTASIDSLTLTSGATVTVIFDEDDMSSDSATGLATQQSIKAYVDSQFTGQTLEFSGDSGGTLSIDLDSETLTLTGGTGIDTTGSVNDLTIAIDSTVATLTGSQTLTNKTLTAPVISSISNTGTLTLPTSTDTLVGRATTDTLTNKTISSASNTITVNLGSATVTGTLAQFNTALSDGSFVSLAGSETLTNKTLTSPTLTSPVITTPQINDTSADHQYVFAVSELAADRTVTLPLLTGNDTFVFESHTQTLTNKTLTTPVISSISNSGTVTLPTGTTTLVGTDTSDVLTNKTISGASNTLSNIGNSSLTNSSVSFGGVSVSLGSSDATPAFDLTDASGYTGDSNLVTTGTITSGVWQGTAVADAYVANDLTISGGTVDNTVIGGTTAAAGTFTSLNVTGDLTVSGTTTTVNSTTVTFDDIVLTLGGDTAPAADDNKDRGLEFRWHNGTTAKLGFFGYDDSASVFTFIPDATESLGAYSGTAGDVSFGAGTFASDVTFTGAAYNVVWDSSDSALEFADNAKAVFGAGSDLQIYHDGSNSIIQDSGTGDLILQGGNDLILRETDGSTEYLRANEGAGVQIFHNGSQKFLTTATGIDVTGTVTADGLTVDGSTTITTADNNAQLTVVSTDTDASVGPRIDFHRNSSSPANGDLLGEIQFQGEDSIGALNIFATISSKADQVDNGAEDGSLHFKTLFNGTLANRLSIGGSGSGDISFYEDTGTTAKFFWDASAESLGLGITSPSATLHVIGPTDTAAISTSSTPAARINNGGAISNWIGANGYNYGYIQTIQDDGTNNLKNLALQPLGGSVGIGTSSPATTLHVNSGSNGEILRVQGADAQLRIDNSTSNVMNINSSGSGDSLTLSTNDTERMRIDSNGNVGIGTDSPVNSTNYKTLHLKGSTGGQILLGSTAENYETYLYNQASGTVLGAVSGKTLQFHSNGTEAMRIDSGGVLGLGNTPQNDWYSSVYSVMQIGEAGGIMSGKSDGNLYLCANAKYASDATWEYINGTERAFVLDMQDTIPLRFRYAASGTADTDITWSEAFRVDTSGNLLVGTPTAAARFNVQHSSTSTPAGLFDNQNAGTSGVQALGTSLPSTANNTNCYHLKSTTQSVSSYYLYGDGSSSFTSDERQKKNIVTTRDGYLDDLKNLRVVDYHWNNQEDTEDKNIGLIAQEVEQVFPNLVVEHELEGAGVRKNLKGSDFTFILIKAIQEQQDLIESLTARIAALEGAN